MATGLLGGWTTMSGFAVETVRLVDAGSAGPAVGYVLATIVAGLAAVALGRVAGVTVAHPPDDEVVE